jgi:hypothetical protein
MQKPEKHVVLIPTNTPSESDPRKMSERATMRWEVGMKHARKLRDDHGRANVLVAAFGGWALHTGLPLALHHLYAAEEAELLKLDELDLLTAHGFNTATDLTKTLQTMGMQLGAGEVNTHAHFVSSLGHAQRAIADTGLHEFFTTIAHIESGETRSSVTEDRDWVKRAREIPPYQIKFGLRGADIARNSASDARIWESRMRDWAEAHPDLWEEYGNGLGSLLFRLTSASNVVVWCDGAGCWKVKINTTAS